MGKIGVLLVEDHNIVRQGLRSLLERESDIEVLGEAENGRQAVELAKSLAPAVVVIDIIMPLLNGTEAARQILQNMPSTKIIALSAHCDEEHIGQAVAAGVSGYLDKLTSAKNLAKAIREVWKGNHFFESSAAKRVYLKFKSSPLKGKFFRPGGMDLTSREIELLQLIAEGMANKQIAEELKISIKTVEKHRQQLRNKLNIQDTAGLTRFAIAHGIVDKA